MSRRPKPATFCAWAFVAVLAVSPVVAQPAADDGLAAARELIAVTRATEHVQQMLPAIMQALKPAIVQGRPEVERDFDAVMPLLLNAVGSRIGEMVDQMAAVYAHNFTPDEIHQLVVFYRGPLGQRFLEKMPVVMQESLAIGQAFGKQIAGELQSRMIEELRKKGHNI